MTIEPFSGIWLLSREFYNQWILENNVNLGWKFIQHGLSDNKQIKIIKSYDKVLQNNFFKTSQCTFNQYQIQRY